MTSRPYNRYVLQHNCHPQRVYSLIFLDILVATYWQRGSVVRTSVICWQTFLIYG